MGCNKCCRRHGRSRTNIELITEFAGQTLADTVKAGIILAFGAVVVGATDSNLIQVLDPRLNVGA